MFDKVDPKQSLPKLEHGILQYWQEEDIFKRSVKQREEGEKFSFYDGPPFATGLPHYGHLLAGTIKDVIPRYQAMRGKFVQRRFGWDCHGLPVENLVERENNIKDKLEIEKMGVDKFCELCCGSVQRYTKEWQQIVERMGRWVDMDWDYRTMDPEYMESIWWVVGQLYKKKLLYEGLKPMHICPHCATPLSNFEVTQGYQDRTDLSVVMTFPLKDDPKTILLAWTTTPWSLPGNTWLAVGDHISYVKVRADDMTYILAEKLVEKIFKEKEYEVLGPVKAKELVGKQYEPLFPYYIDAVVPRTEKSGNPETYGERVFKVVMHDEVEVSDEEGTGIVHITSCLGGDSYAVAVKEDVDVIHHVGIDGLFAKEVTDFQGVHVKPEGKDPMATDKLVIQYLKDHGRYFSHFPVTHSYPHCWRCDSPLLPYTTNSWFVKVEEMKEKLLANNAKTDWVPAHMRDGRFGNWLEGARDWSISRNRYWGTPLPIWKCEETGDIEIVESRDELMSRAQTRFTKITALRHGESAGNLIPIYQAEEPGTDLTKDGKKQAEATGALLSGNKNTASLSTASLPVDIIYCSPLARTRQTAQAVADATGAELIVDERLREVNFGEYEGKTVDFDDLSLVKARRAHKFKKNAPESIYHFSGMETWRNVQDRIVDFLQEVLPKHRSQHIVIVTHADPIQNIKHFFTKEDPVKISRQPYPRYADPNVYYWDHDHEAQMDLHKHAVDDIVWPISSKKHVDATFVRHGQTDRNKERIISGQTDVPLNDQGKQQVAELATQLNGQQFDLIISSDLKRTVESAEILSKELNIPYEAQWTELRERNLGEFEGKKRDEIVPKDCPSAAQAILMPKGGETNSQFFERIQLAATKLLKEYEGKRILVVGHGGVIKGLKKIFLNCDVQPMENASAVEIRIVPLAKRIPEVLDCWFESGSMPYAQSHFPFNFNEDLPTGFPADFIAEGVDQTRGWFYTLMVLSTALFDKPAFHHCVVNGIVLAEDGKKMSKRLKNYPEPTVIIDKYGADAIRFTLMSSPAVRGEDLRMSEKLVEETVRNVLLPLWNAYGFFVTYANAASFEPTPNRRESKHPLDKWIRAEVQDLTNRMTEQLDAYDLSATCAEIHDTINALTNWYIRLSRRRFAGKRAAGDEESASAQQNIDVNEEDQLDALHTLNDVLLTISQLLAPFCPFITDAIYLNLVSEEHGSVHLTDWPQTRDLKKEETHLLQKMRLMRTIVSLGLSVRSEQKIKVRQPLQSSTVAVPPTMNANCKWNDDDLALLKSELNVKELHFTDDPGELAEVIAQVDARAVGPRLGARVQEIIKAGKEGEFTEQKDGSVLILDETLSPNEVQIVYRGKEGQNAAADHGVVVSVDTEISDVLQLEGLARDLIRAIQRLRKESGLSFTDSISLSIDGADDILESHNSLIAHETKAVIVDNKGEQYTIELDARKVTIRFAKR